MKNHITNRIAFDLDDVLAHSAERLVAISNEHWGTDLTADDFQEDWVSMWGVDITEVERRALTFNDDDIVQSYTAFEEAMPVLDKLKSHGDELIITTSRVSAIKESTVKWLGRHFDGVFDGIFHAGIYDGGEDVRNYLMTKGDLYKKLEIDYAIDDQPKHVLAARSLGCSAVLFGDYSWNRSQQSEVMSKGGVCISDWQALQEYFDEQQFA